jgi:hypothetical protein
MPLIGKEVEVVEETSAIQAQADVQQRDPVACPVQQKRLAEMGPDGMYLWCKACRREHLFTWAEIDLVRKHVYGAEQPGSE